MNMFEFTSTNPGSEKVWEELSKASMPTGLPSDLTRTMLWILLNASKDFSKAKDVVNKLLNGDTSLDKLRKSFRNALLKMDNVVPIDVNPTTMQVPTYSPSIFCDTSQELFTPIMIFKDMMKDANPDAVVFLANKVFPVSAQMEENLRIDIKIHKNDFSTMTVYGLQTIPDSDLFGDHFRGFFRPEDENSVSTFVEIEDYDQLKTSAKDLLIEAIEAGNSFVELPTYKLKDDKESE